MSERTRSGGAGGGGKRGGRSGGATSQAPTGVTKRAMRGAATAAPPAPGAPITRRRGSGLTQDVALHPSLFGLTDPDAVLRNARIAAPRGPRPAPAPRKPTAKKAAVKKPAAKKGSRTTRATSAASAAQPTPLASTQPQPSLDAEDDGQDLSASPALDEATTVAGDEPVANDDSTARAEQEAADREAAEQEAAEHEVDEGLRQATKVADLAKKQRAANERAAKEKADKEKAENEERERVERENAEKEKAERERVEKARVEKENLEREKFEKEKAEKEADRKKAEREKAEKERAREEAAAKEEAARKEAEEKAAQEKAEKEREEKEYQDWLREQAAREDEEFRKGEELEEEEARKQEALEEEEARKQEAPREKQRIEMQEIIKENRKHETLLEYERAKGYKKAGAGLKRAAESGPEREDASKKTRLENDAGPICNDKDSCDKFKRAIIFANFKFKRTGSAPAVKIGQPLSLDIMFQGLAAVTEAINESRAAQSQSRLYGLFHPRSLVDVSLLNHPATPKLHEAFVPIVRKAGSKTHHSLIVLFQTRPKSEDQSEFFEMHHYDSDRKMRNAFETTGTGKLTVKESIKKTGWAGRVEVNSVLGATKTQVVCDRPDGHEWAVGIHIILNGWVCALNLKHNPNALLGKTGFYEQAVNLINFAIWGFIGSQVILDFFDCYEYTLLDDMDERVREHLRKGRTFKDSKDFSDYGKLDRHIGRMTGRIPARQTAQPQTQQANKPEPKTPTSAKPADVFPKGVFGDILGGMDTSAGYAAADEAPKPKPTGQGPTISKADQKILDDAAAGRVNDENQDEERNERRKAKAEVRAKKAKVVDNDPDAAEVADVVQEYPASDYDDSNTDDEYMNDAEDDADGVPLKPVFESPPALEKVSKWAKHNEALAKTKAFQKQQPQPAEAREASVELEDPETEDLFDADIDFDADIEYEADGEVENLFPGVSVPSNSPPRPGPTSAPHPTLQPTVEEEDLYSSGDHLPHQAPEPRRPSLALPPRPNPQAPPPTPHDPPSNHTTFPVFTIPQPAVNLTLTNPEGTTYTPRVSASQVSLSAFVKAVVPRPIAVPNISGTFAVPDTPSTSDESQKDGEQAEATEEDEDLLQEPPRVFE